MFDIKVYDNTTTMRTLFDAEPDGDDDGGGISDTDGPPPLVDQPPGASNGGGGGTSGGGGGGGGGEEQEVRMPVAEFLTILTAGRDLKSPFGRFVAAEHERILQENQSILTDSTTTEDLQEMMAVAWGSLGAVEKAAWRSGSGCESGEEDSFDGEGTEEEEAAAADLMTLAEDVTRMKMTDSAGTGAATTDAEDTTVAA